MYDLSKVVVTSSPHIKAGDDTRSLMLDVLIALLPALCVAVYTFGWRALVLTVISMVACAVFETIYNKIVGHPNTVGDLSCFVTGVLIAFNVPVSAPWWMVVFGALFGLIGGLCGLVLGGFGVILGGVLALVRSLMLFASAPMNALVNMGLSFVCIALGAVLAGIGVAIVQKLVPWVLGLIGRLVKWVSGKVGGGR